MTIFSKQAKRGFGKYVSIHLVGNPLFSDVSKPLSVNIDTLDKLCFNAKTKLFEFVGKLIAINQVDGWSKAQITTG